MKDKVIFKILHDEVIALFPEIPWHGSLITSYMHVGQHSGAHKDLLEELKPATTEQYADLEKELTDSMGYKLEVQNVASQSIGAR